MAYSYRVMVFGLSVCLSLVGAAFAQNIQTKASHAVIMDGETGQILFSKDGQTPIPPASMSKLMTVGVVLDLIEKGKLSPDTRFKVSEKAWRTGGSKMFVLVNDEIRVDDLLKGIITLSGNDATVVVAENIAGNEAAFAKLMNERAEAWGLEQSSFSNPHGLNDEDQRMSAADIARLAKILWDNYPDFRYIFSIPEMTWSDITQKNRNPLVNGYDGADGMKTGHTEEAGYGVVGSAEKDGARRIIVVTGLESMDERARESRRIMDIAFSEFKSQSYYSPGDIVTELPVFGGKSETLGVSVNTEIAFTRHRSILDKAEASVSHKEPLIAPIRQGEQVAIMRLTLPGEEVREYPLYASTTVGETGILSKMNRGLRILFTPPELAE